MPALRARRACARSARAGKAQSEAAGESEGGYVHVRKWQRLSSRRNGRGNAKENAQEK